MKRKLKKQAKKVAKRQVRALDSAELAQVSGGTYYYTTTRRGTASSTSGCYGNCSAG